MILNDDLIALRVESSRFTLLEELMLSILSNNGKKSLQKRPSAPLKAGNLFSTKSSSSRLQTLPPNSLFKSSSILLQQHKPIETRRKEMHPETYSITSRYFVPPKQRQEAQKISVPFYEGRFMSLGGREVGKLIPFYYSLGEDNTIDSYTLNFGPQHPAAHGVLRLLLELKVGC